MPRHLTSLIVVLVAGLALAMSAAEPSAVDSSEDLLVARERLLRAVARDPAEALPALAEALLDDHPVIRRYASLSLIEAHPLSEGADFDMFIKRLLEQFETAPAHKRQTMVEFLAAMDPSPLQAARVIATATGAQDPNVRKIAYNSILARADADWPDDLSERLTTDLPPLEMDEKPKK